MITDLRDEFYEMKNLGCGLARGFLGSTVIKTFVC